MLIKYKCFLWKKGKKIWLYKIDGCGIYIMWDVKIVVGERNENELENGDYKE